MITEYQVRRVTQRVALSAALLLAVASAALADRQGYRAAIEHRACAGDLHLDPSTADYQACVSVLDRELSDTRSAVPAAMANESVACADIGFHRNTLANEQCALDLRATLWNEDNATAR